MRADFFDHNPPQFLTRFWMVRTHRYFLLYFSYLEPLLKQLFPALHQLGPAQLQALVHVQLTLWLGGEGERREIGRAGSTGSGVRVRPVQPQSGQGDMWIIEMKVVRGEIVRR